MRFSSLAVFVAAGLAAAQSTTTTAAASSSTSSSSCAAQNILDLCRSQLEAQAKQCAADDWDCLCNSYTNILTCYNNCPQDSGAFGASQQKQQFCQAASIYGSSASKTSSATATASVSGSLSSALASASSASASVSSALSSASSAAASGSRSASGSASGSASASAATQTGAAANVIIPAGGVLGMVIGAAALL